MLLDTEEEEEGKEKGGEEEPKKKGENRVNLGKQIQEPQEERQEMKKQEIGQQRRRNERRKRKKRNMYRTINKRSCDKIISNTRRANKNIKRATGCYSMGKFIPKPCGLLYMSSRQL